MIKKYLKRLNRYKSQQNNPDLSLSGHKPGTFEFKGLEQLSDNELEHLNNLLPWASWVVDRKGRRFGNRFSYNKRNNPEEIPDKRIVELNKRYDLSDKHVLEIGCFEGNHTIALATYAKKVTAIDSRVEHVVKTLTRCAMAQVSPSVHCWDVEDSTIPSQTDLNCDVLHHVGVLYHLLNPVEHLKRISPFVRDVIMLDTHVAPENVELKRYGEVQYWEFAEHGRDNPFAGMYGHAKWIVLKDLIQLLHSLGFSHVDVAEQRTERSGPRVLIYAHR